MVTVLGLPGRGASQVEKSLRLNWAIQFLTVASDGACSPNFSFRISCISFDALRCRKKIDDSSRLDVEIPHGGWHAPFSLCKKKTWNSAHDQPPPSNDTIDSVPRHREVGRAKDLSTPLRTFLDLPVVMPVTFGAIFTAFCLLEASTSQIHAAVFSFHQWMKLKRTYCGRPSWT